MKKSLSDIPVVMQKSTAIESGQKYLTEQGFSAIKDGMKIRDHSSDHVKKPGWLKIRLASSPKYTQVKQRVRDLKLSTVCEEAKCPNISECWSHGTATIM